MALTRRGKPVAVLVGIRGLGLDLEQIELGSPGEFWALIRKRRRQQTSSRAECRYRFDTPGKDDNPSLSRSATRISDPR